MTEQSAATEHIQDAFLLEAQAVATRLGVDPATGLSDEEATRRLKADGPNELRGKPPLPAWRRILAQFHDPLIYLLLAAVAISRRAAQHIERFRPVAADDDHVGVTRGARDLVAHMADFQVPADLGGRQLAGDMPPDPIGRVPLVLAANSGDSCTDGIQLDDADHLQGKAMECSATRDPSERPLPRDSPIRSEHKALHDCVSGARLRRRGNVRPAGSRSDHDAPAELSCLRM